MTSDPRKPETDRIISAANMTLDERIAAYLADSPANGGHSDDAGANAYELLEEARYELRPPAQTGAASELADEIEQSNGLIKMLPGPNFGTVQLGIKKTAQVIAALRAASPPQVAPTEIQKQWESAWHKTAMGIMTILGLSASQSAAEMIADVQAYVSAPPTGARSVDYIEPLLDPNRPQEADYERGDLSRRIKEHGPVVVASILTAYANGAPKMGSYAGSLWAIAEWVATQFPVASDDCQEERGQK